MDYASELNQALNSSIATPSLSVRNREIVPNLRAQRQELEARIHKIDKLLSMLEKNPEFSVMLDLTRELI